MFILVVGLALLEDGGQVASFHSWALHDKLTRSAVQVGHDIALSEAQKATDFLRL
jgi:hypothetical protein